MLVLGLWALSMLSGLIWSKRWTASLCILTIIVFGFSQGNGSSVKIVSNLSGLTWWIGLLVIGFTPWLLAMARERAKWIFKSFQAQEAKKLQKLSDTARSLLSIERSTQQLEASVAESTDLYHVTKETSRLLHLGDLFTSLIEILPRLIDVQGIRLIDLCHTPYRVFRAVRSANGRLLPDKTSEASLLEEQIIKDAQKNTSSIIGDNIQEGGGTKKNDLGSRIKWIVLSSDQKQIGILVADGLSKEQDQKLIVVARQLSLQMSRIRLYEQVESLAVTDDLTGLFVRRYFLERAKDEIIRSKRHNLSCTIAMVDLDRFKQKNDTFGHLAGDVVLREVAKRLQKNLREVDLMARLGGEEFVLLLIETTSEEAMPVAQRLRQLVDVRPVQAYDELISQTISVGVASYPEDAETLEDLIEHADQALYAAKRAGRNKVIKYNSSSNTTAGNIH